MNAQSRIEGFRALTPDQRREEVQARTGAPDALRGQALSLTAADGMIENVIGVFELPLGVASNFTVNGRDYLIPMAVEEPSVVAAASYMARIVRGCGGFQAETDEPVMRAQVQVLGLTDLKAAGDALIGARDHLLETANARDKMLVSLGGGCRDIEIHSFEDTPIGPMLVMHLLVDVRDAAVKPFNDLRDSLRVQLQKDASEDYVKRLLRDAKIVLYDGKGNVLPFNKQPKSISD